ncbi:hypothetical protein NQ176_g8100 [Zarea fungicola]|uniref:Uncharacterized protein n=1 Tax=Zarea fungicola TaxID=93591 RepID=A0ACC1MUV0_9HYPO|nr:hypothetical protein NQ176_g8100 [Lecanicillium fungicola]
MFSMREQLLQTANAFITSFNEFTAESVIAHRSPTCLHHILPSTVKAAPQTNAEYSAYIQGLKSVMRNFTLHHREGQPPIVDEVARQVVLEYMCVLTLNEDGTMIDKIVQSVDSAYVADRVKALKEAAHSKLAK